MCLSCCGRMRPSPQRPCDGAGGLDPALCPVAGPAAAFLDGPSDQGGGCGNGAMAATAIMAKAGVTRETWRCQPCLPARLVLIAVSKLSSIAHRWSSIRARVSMGVPCGPPVEKKARSPSAMPRRIHRSRARARRKAAPGRRWQVRGDMLRGSGNGMRPVPGAERMPCADPGAHIPCRPVAAPSRYRRPRRLHRRLAGKTAPAAPTARPDATQPKAPAFPRHAVPASRTAPTSWEPSHAEVGNKRHRKARRPGPAEPRRCGGCPRGCARPKSRNRRGGRSPGHAPGPRRRARPARSAPRAP